MTFTSPASVKAAFERRIDGQSLLHQHRVAGGVQADTNQIFDSVHQIVVA